MKTSNKFACQLPLVLLAAMLQFNASAAVQTYTTLSAFTAGLQAGYYLENFNAVGPSGPYNFTGGTPSFSYSFTSPGSVTPVDVVGGSRAISTFDANDLLTLTFGANKPTAIGGDFFWTDLLPGQAVAGSIRVQYGGASEFFNVPQPSGGTFLGITTDNPAGFSALTISLVGYTTGNYYPTVDNVVVGNAVPEPRGWVFISLFAAGWAGWRILRRRLAPQ